MLHKPFLNVSHHAQRELGGEDAGVLPLILLEDVGLYRTAHLAQRPGTQLRPFVVGDRAFVLGLEAVHQLINGGVHEHRQQSGGRPVDGHRYRGGGVTQVEPPVQHLHVIQRGNGNP